MCTIVVWWGEEHIKGHCLYKRSRFLFLINIIVTVQFINELLNTLVFCITSVARSTTLARILCNSSRILIDFSNSLKTSDEI